MNKIPALFTSNCNCCVFKFSANLVAATTPDCRDGAVTGKKEENIGLPKYGTWPICEFVIEKWRNGPFQKHGIGPNMNVLSFKDGEFWRIPTVKMLSE